ncbi:uncharacterized protein [Rutidosis leptorrhynchoides]|uniref:uncharacterized protein n=1 Tax=Rutidosis leptorrhynchoides TaxID=125765 RepID=UPI003A99BFED
MEMKKWKAYYKRLHRRELERLAELKTSIYHSYDELHDAVEIMAKNHGLVFCLVFPTIYTSHGEHGHYNWEYIYTMDYGDEFYEYKKTYYYKRDGFGKLALKAFETYHTYLSTNFSELIPATVAQSCLCLGMCLKNINIDADSHDCVFDMIFKLDDDNIRQPFVFLDSLFKELEECLPSFQLSSGTQFGRQSLVLDSHTYKAWEEHQPSSVSCIPSFKLSGTEFDCQLPL